QNMATSSAVIQSLHELGVALHIDDFGTGYSSLAYLHTFPIDALKVDKSFVSRMETSPGQAEIVKAVVTLAQNLGMSVTAEGVETRAQADNLRAMRCTRAQGFVYSPPVPAAEAEMLIVDGIRRLEF
ncbi:MAG: EAL domain-containing protein, partial [Myxococcales bacterium]